MVRNARRLAALLAAGGAVLMFASGASAAVAPTVTAAPVSSLAIPTNAPTVTLSWLVNAENTSFAVTDCVTVPLVGTIVLLNSIQTPVGDGLHCYKEIGRASCRERV